ncbi:mitochondrial cardiolipin hydrolase-like isoform X1 [Diabrotica virgifera virgifera]|uniref:Mitochondrial cardiolipin hydrolase n=1 Tax=Diabrotica virgifera virgifera TaxID=50390 RepID=A0ABM5L0D2_DIAVI|nr:mitochondrial cardiolipin hydrolase-like isoform X1 [Diabrotica virgifera virgifera]
MNKFLCIFISVSSITLPILLTYVVKRRYRRKIQLLLEKDNNCYYQLLAVDMRNFNCRQHLYDTKVECGEQCSLAYYRTIQNFISSAKSSICLCVLMLTLSSVVRQLVDAKKRGMTVRIIIDKVMLDTKVVKSNFTYMAQQGIPFKFQPLESSKMHHKFCLIDKDEGDGAKMFFGSLNLTSQGFCKNFDNTILTNNKEIISRFSEEFEELWELF